MKKISLIALFLFITYGTSFSQDDSPDEVMPPYMTGQNQGEIAGGLGLTWIDGKPHYTFMFRPELAFMNFGVGLDLRLEFDSEGNIRTENFNETSDYLSIIRYVRYGLKRDPFYVRVGALDYATLGHGTQMYLYNNSPTVDARRIGMELDIDFEKFGFESVYGAFGEAGVLGFRGYVRPLQYTSLSAVPIISNFEIGATFTGDFHDKAGVTAGYYVDSTDKFLTLKDEGAINIVGFDFGLPVLRTGIVNVDLYFDYNKILGFGSGSATGAIFNFSGLGIVTVHAKFERRFNGDEYIPSYFNSFYELDRFQVAGNDSTFTSKAAALSGASLSDGFFGMLGVDLAGLFQISGSYQRLDDDPKSGILNLRTDIAPEEAPFVARAGYDKVNIQDEKDVFTLDERSYLYTEVGYKPIPYLLISTIYSWTFTPERDADDAIIGYKTQKRIEPRISFIYPFDF